MFQLFPLIGCSLGPMVSTESDSCLASGLGPIAKFINVVPYAAMNHKNKFIVSL